MDKTDFEEMESTFGPTILNVPSMNFKNSETQSIDCKNTEKECSKLGMILYVNLKRIQVSLTISFRKIQTNFM